MNKQYILLNLHEALEEIDRTIRKLQNELEYNEPEFRIAMEHAFHHMNIAWNARNTTKEQAFECSAKDFDSWGKFPKDIDFSS
jgi:hypothetical protein